MPKQKKIVFLDIDGVLLPAADPLAPCYRDACAPDPDTGKKPTAVERTLRLLNTELLKTIKADYQRDPENYKCVLLTNRCLGKSRMERQLLQEQDLPQDLLATQHLISALEQEVGIKPELVTGFSNASVDGVQDTNCDFYKKQFLNYEITGKHESELDAFEKNKLAGRMKYIIQKTVGFGSMKKITLMYLVEQWTLVILMTVKKTLSLHSIVRS